MLHCRAPLLLAVRVRAPIEVLEAVAEACRAHHGSGNTESASSALGVAMTLAGMRQRGI